MKDSLDDYALFLAVADAGGLSGAARTTGQSAATLSRRMTALERRLDRRLFERGQRGYTLTAAGRALLAEAEPLRGALQRLNRFAEASTRPRVRITAGFWTSQFIARHLPDIWSPEALWIPELVTSNAAVDIARREADIGIRNRRPDQNWLAGRKTLTVVYAEYATARDVAGYLSAPEDQARTPSDRWLRKAHGDVIVTTASDPRLRLDLALAGLGRIVLPCFAGDAVEGLSRVSPEIRELSHEEWLVAHHDARQDPPIRAALDAITDLLCNTDLRPSTVPALERRQQSP